MRMIVPFASVLPEAGMEALRSLKLPRLEELLRRASPGERDEGDEYSLSPPHERALARAVGLTGGDGALPWAAWAAARDRIDTLDLAWGQLTPAHWHVGADQITLADPQALQLGDAESRALFDAAHPLFESEGFVLSFGAPTRWYAAHESLAHLPTASLDRVIGRNVDRWLPDAKQARTIRRLQSEVQMLFHQHPVNAAREAQGALAVNSFWISGCGVAQPADMPADLRVQDSLREPALAEDLARWVDRWRALDAGPMAEALAHVRQGKPLTLTLCGERSAAEFTFQPRSLWRRLSGAWRSTPASSVLESL